MIHEVSITADGVEMERNHNMLSRWRHLKNKDR